MIEEKIDMFSPRDTLHKCLFTLSCIFINIQTHCKLCYLKKSLMNVDLFTPFSPSIFYNLNEFYSALFFFADCAPSCLLSVLNQGKISKAILQCTPFVKTFLLVKSSNMCPPLFFSKDDATGMIQVQCNSCSIAAFSNTDRQSSDLNSFQKQ